MKFKILAIFTVLLLLVSCSSKRRVVKSKQPSTKKEAVVTTPKVAEPPQKTKTYADSKLAYIDRYSEIAMREMRIYKIPASITLAQGILESRSGQSELTRKSNNHFGIKCHKSWDGGRTYHDDDEKGECFRVYKHAEESFKDHSLFLAERTRYQDLFRLKITDYKGWAKGLQKAGYATDRAYPQKLINIVESYQLYQYDDKVLGKRSRKKDKKKFETPPNSITVIKGDTLYSISKRVGLTVDQLKSINGLDSNEISIGQKLFVEK